MAAAPRHPGFRGWELSALQRSLKKGGEGPGPLPLPRVSQDQAALSGLRSCTAHGVLPPAAGSARYARRK